MPFGLNKSTGTRWHTCHRELRWSDFDQYQHVNNAKYVEFAQDSRMVFLKDVLMEMDVAIPPLFVRHATVDYPHPLSPGESEVAVRSFITDIGTKSCTMRQEIRDSNARVACVLDTVMVGIDIMTGKSRPWTGGTLSTSAYSSSQPTRMTWLRTSQPGPCELSTASVLLTVPSRGVVWLS